MKLTKGEVINEVFKTAKIGHGYHEISRYSIEQLCLACMCRYAESDEPENNEILLDETISSIAEKYKYPKQILGKDTNPNESDQPPESPKGSEGWDDSDMESFAEWLLLEQFTMNIEGEDGEIYRSGNEQMFMNTEDIFKEWASYYGKNRKAHRKPTPESPKTETWEEKNARIYKDDLEYPELGPDNEHNQPYQRSESPKDEGEFMQDLFDLINDGSPNPLQSQMFDIIRLVHKKYPDESKDEEIQRLKEDLEMEVSAATNAVKDYYQTILNLQSENKALKERVQELEKEDRWSDPDFMAKNINK